MNTIKSAILVFWVLGSSGWAAALTPIDPMSVRAYFTYPLSSSSGADFTWIEIVACESPDKCEQTIDRIRVPDFKGLGTPTLKFGKLDRVRLVQQLSEQREHPIAEAQFLDRWYQRSELCRGVGGDTLCQYTVYRNDTNHSVSLKVWGEPQ